MKILNMHKFNYKQIDENHYSVTYVGHFDDNYSHVDNELNKSGLVAIRRTYDKKNNRTNTIYKKVG